MLIIHFEENGKMKNELSILTLKRKSVVLLFANTGERKYVDKRSGLIESRNCCSRPKLYIHTARVQRTAIERKQNKKEKTAGFWALVFSQEIL